MMQAMRTEMRVNNHALDVTNLADRSLPLRRNHQLSLPHRLFPYHSQQNQRLLMSGWINRTKILFHITMDIAGGRIAQTVQLVYLRDIFSGREAQRGDSDRHPLALWVLSHGYVVSFLALFFARQQQKRDQGIPGAGQQQ